MLTVAEDCAIEVLDSVCAHHRSLSGGQDSRGIGLVSPDSQCYVLKPVGSVARLRSEHVIAGLLPQKSNG